MLPLTLDLIEFLQSDPARAALEELGQADLSEAAGLVLLLRLRKRFSASQAAALLDQARLRRAAGAKFPHPQHLLFTDEALQQASSRSVAVYRAGQIAAAVARTRPAGSPSSPLVADLGCGIGADTVALAEAGLHVLAVERDAVLARLAAANLAALHLSARVTMVHADWTALGELPVAAAFVDPSRRRGEQRIFRPDDMEPPIAAVLALVPRVPAVALKTAPGIADEDIPPNAEVEFISERGAMKEALLRFGALRTGTARRATLLPGPHSLDSNAPREPVSAGQPQSYLIEPDAAVLRAGLVQHLATQIGASQLDPTIAYLTVDKPVVTPWGRSWRVLRHGPFGLKTLNRWLADLAPGEVVVKKRGSAVHPDDFRRRLKTTPGGPRLTVFLTRVQGRPWMVVGVEALAAQNGQSLEE